MTQTELPEWTISQWFNTDGAELTLHDLRGKIAVIETFQMLCPGCVMHGLPLAQQINSTFSKDKVAVIGLHTVFEHHKAMTPVSLQAFLHEYRITFPVGVDTAGNGSIPVTMERYGLRGTPSLLLVNTDGKLVSHHFGQISPLQLGAEIGGLLSETTQSQSSGSECTGEGCTV